MLLEMCHAVLGLYFCWQQSACVDMGPAMHLQMHHHVPLWQLHTKSDSLLNLCLSSCANDGLRGC
jgi:hypothetical protein